MTWAHAKRWSVLLVALALLPGCAGETPPTVAQLTLAADAEVNPDNSGRPSPIVLRIYELGGHLNFDRADFLQLYESDTATLGADLKGKSEVLLKPGQVTEAELTLKPDAAGIGILALYRDYEAATWRAFAAVPAARKTPLRVEIGAHAVTLKAGGKD